MVRVAASAWLARPAQGEGARRSGDELAGITVDAIARHRGEALDLGSPASQVGKKVLTTASPTANSSTPSPTAITSPAPSAIGMRGSLGPHMPLTTAKS